MPANRHLSRRPFLTFVVLVVLMLGARPGSGEPWQTTYSCDLILTQSTEAHLIPCGTCKHGSGGLPRRAALVASCRDTADFVVLADAGDFRKVEDAPDVEHDRFYLEEMERLGYSVLGVGVQDLSLGARELQDLVRPHGMALVAANIAHRETGALVFEPFAIVDVGTRRLAFTGFIDPYLWEERAHLQPEIEILSPADALRSTIGAIGDAVDLVVLFAHMKKHHLEPLLQEIDGFDVVVVGNRPRPLRYPRPLGLASQVFYSDYGGRFVNHSRVEIWPDEVRTNGGHTHYMRQGMPEDAAVRRRVYEFLGVDEPAEPATLTTP